MKNGETTKSEYVTTIFSWRSIGPTSLIEIGMSMGETRFILIGCDNILKMSETDIGIYYDWVQTVCGGSWSLFLD